MIRWQPPLPTRPRIGLTLWGARELAWTRELIANELQSVPFETWHEIMGGPIPEARFHWIAGREILYIGEGAAGHVLLFVYPVPPLAGRGLRSAVTPAEDLPDVVGFSMSVAERQAFDDGTLAFELVDAPRSLAIEALNEWAVSEFPYRETLFWRRLTRWLTHPQDRRDLEVRWL